jgi:hypothetical protein
MRPLLLFAVLLLAGCDPADFEARIDWPKFRNQVEEMREAGRYAEAVAALTPHLPGARRELADDPAELGRVLELLGDVQRDFDAQDAALAAYAESQALYERAYGRRHHALDAPRRLLERTAETLAAAAK